jgi:hypothetical protein
VQLDDDETKPPANPSFLGAACAVSAVMIQLLAALFGLNPATRVVIIVVAPALAVLGIWLSLSARRGLGPAIGGLVVSMAAFVFTGTIAAAVFVVAIT